MTIITDNVETLIDIIGPPRQHDEHMKQWRWKLYLAGYRERLPYFRTDRERVIWRQANERLNQFDTM